MFWLLTQCPRGLLSEPPTAPQAFGDTETEAHHGQVTCQQVLKCKAEVGPKAAHARPCGIYCLLLWQIFPEILNVAKNLRVLRRCHERTRKRKS